MSLSNKASKILRMFQDYSTNQCLDIAHSINKKNVRNGNTLRYSTKKSDYIDTMFELQSKLDEMQAQGNNLRLDYLKTYMQYIKQEISLEDLKSSKAYIEMNDLFRKNNPRKCYINSDSIFKNLSFNHSINDLYLMKNIFIKRAVKEYAELSKSKQAYKYRLSKTTDTSIMPNQLSGKCYSTTLNFVIRGYNAPFSVHGDPKTIEELENKYGISIEEGNITRPFSASVPYKYNSEQRKRIGQITRTLKRNNKYPRLCRISEFSNNMQFAPSCLSLTTYEQEEEERLEETDISKTTQIPPNVEDDSDAPSL